jgi:plastocyanin
MLVAALIALATAAVVTRAGAREEARVIALVARGMSFYLAGNPTTANPAIPVRPGERVRFVLRNETPGIQHDLAIPSLGVLLPPLAAGAAGSVDLEVPDRPGAYEYQCRPHAVMMKGTIVVKSGS